MLLSTPWRDVEVKEVEEDSVCALERGGKAKELRRETPALGRLGGVEWIDW